MALAHESMSTIIYACFLPDCNKTADDFNLTSYDSWSQEVSLTLKEKSALKSLLGKSSEALC